MASGWSEDPTESQNFWYETIGHVKFDKYEPDTKEGLLILRKKIGFAIYGLPQEQPSEQNGETGYSEKMLKNIKKVASCIINVNKKKKADVNKKKVDGDVNKKKLEKRNLLKMAIVFVCVDSDQHLMQFPVFRVLITELDDDEGDADDDSCGNSVPDSELEWQFVDTDCRVYLTWKNFLAENELPAGKFCWPEEGIYHCDSDGKLKLGWGLTPNGKIPRKVLARVDTISTVAAVGSTGVIIAGMLTPVIAPVAVAAGVCTAVTGAYSAVRSASSLVDQGVHQQNINPFTSKQAAASWLSVVGSTVGFAAGAMVSRAASLARNGQVISKVEQTVCNALNIAALAVNATGVGFGAYFIGERIKDREVTALEVFQFTASVLFFTHSVVNFQSASTIIKNTQKGILRDYEKSLRSNRHRKQFKKLAKSTVASSETAVEGNAKVIRSIRNIDNADDFFAGMVRIRKDLSGNKAVFSENGNIIINDGVEIHPMKMYELGKQQRLEILSQARQAAKGAFLDTTFVDSLNRAANTRVSASASKTAQTNEAEVALTAQLQTKIKNWNIRPEDVRLAILFVDELTELVHAHTNNKYEKLWHKIWTHVSNLALMMLDTYQDCKRFEQLFSTFWNGGKIDVDTIQKGAEFSFFVVNIYEQYKCRISDLIHDIKQTEEEQATT